MKYLVVIFFLTCLTTLNAQEELSLFFHPDVVQSGQLQPAYEGNSKFTIGFGSSYLHGDFRGPKLRDLTVSNEFLANLASSSIRNYLSADASFNVFDVGFKKNDWWWRFGYNNNTHLYADFSPNFAKLFINGNGDKVGETLDFGPDFYARQYSELYVGASLPIYEFYRLGANLKFISGSFDISTPSSELSLTTGEEIYEITLKNDYLVNTSYNSLEFSLRELVPFSRPLQDNLGVSADFGFQFLSEQWDVSVSLLDVGLINWKSNVINLQGEGEFTFDGFTFDELNLDTISQLGDTLLSVFNVNVTNKSYNTTTPVKVIAGGEYHRNNTHFGAMLYGEWKQNRFIPAVGVNIRQRIWKAWDLGISYAYKNNTYSNIGVSSVLNLGPFQAYALTDNIIGPFLPSISRKVNVRLGVNLIFWKLNKPKQALPSSETAALF
ncbi:DUF5723 family protein [Saprospiraceae bacterium]|nr:DUF5723 family protein [Saprospiraceae bacterium]